jgi:hypothetical protein
VCWFEGDDLTDYDLINQFKTQALQDLLVFGLTLNRTFLLVYFPLLFAFITLNTSTNKEQYVDDELFKYAMPNNTITATIPIGD